MAILKYLWTLLKGLLAKKGNYFHNNKTTIIMSEVTAKYVKETPGKIDDFLFPAEKLMGLLGELLKEVREEFVNEQGYWKDNFGFTDGIKLANYIIRSVDRLGVQAFDKDLTPEIKSQVVNLILAAIGINYNK